MPVYLVRKKEGKALDIIPTRWRQWESLTMGEMTPVDLIGGMAPLDGLTGRQDTWFLSFLREVILETAGIPSMRSAQPWVHATVISKSSLNRGSANGLNPGMPMPRPWSTHSWSIQYYDSLTTDNSILTMAKSPKLWFPHSQIPLRSTNSLFIANNIDMFLD